MFSSVQAGAELRSIAISAGLLCCGPLAAGICDRALFEPADPKYASGLRFVYVYYNLCSAQNTTQNLKIAAFSVNAPPTNQSDARSGRSAHRAGCCDRNLWCKSERRYDTMRVDACEIERAQKGLKNRNTGSSRINKVFEINGE